MSDFISRGRDWIRWIRVLYDPSEKQRVFSLAGLEFKPRYAEAVEGEMRGTLPGDNHTQPGKFWVIAEDELMRVCPKMASFAQGEDWFFPVEFCDAFMRPVGVEPVPTRDATDEEREEALHTFESVKTRLK